MEGIISAVITGAITLVGIIVTNITTARKQEAKLEQSQAVLNERIIELTREVREHNGFAKRMPVVEREIEIINEKVGRMEKVCDRNHNES